MAARHVRRGLSAIKKVITSYRYRKKDGTVVDVPTHKRTYYVKKVAKRARTAAKRAGAKAKGKVGVVGRKLKDPRFIENLAEAVAIAAVISRAIQDIGRISGRRATGVIETIGRKTPFVHMAIDTRDFKLRDEIAKSMAVIQLPNGEFEYIFGVESPEDALHKVQLTGNRKIPIGSLVWYKTGRGMEVIGSKLPRTQYIELLKQRGDLERLKDLAEWKSRELKEQIEERMSKDKARILTLYLTGQTEKLTPEDLLALKKEGFTLSPEDEQRLKEAQSKLGYSSLKPSFSLTSSEKKELSKITPTSTTSLGKKETPPPTITTGAESYLSYLEKKRREIKKTGAYTVEPPTQEDIDDAIQYLWYFDSLVGGTYEKAKEEVSRLLREYDYDKIHEYAEMWRAETGQTNVFSSL